MLGQVPVTIPAEARDFPEWHHGRETYAVWILPLVDDAVREKFEAAREHLDGYLLEPYRRQPHITLFVCGFLADRPHYNDDFTHSQVQAQLGALEKANIMPFEIEIGGLNSFASAPFLEVDDPSGGIPRLREVLSHGAREFRSAPYTPHLTVGLYAGAFPSEAVMQRSAGFSREPIRWTVNQLTLATYKAQEFAGRLRYEHRISLETGTGDV
jgi:2'-5' RNA ligase